MQNNLTLRDLDLASQLNANLNFVPQEILSKFNLMSPTLSGIMHDLDKWPSFTGVAASILKDSDHPTAESKADQCCLELKVYSSQLLAESLDYEELQIKLQILEIDLQNENDLLKNKLLQVQKKRLMLQKTELENTIMSRFSIIEIFYNILKQFSGGVLNLDVDRHQLKSYAIKFFNNMLNSHNASYDVLRNLQGLSLTILRMLFSEGQLNAVLKNYSEEQQAYLDPILARFEEQKLIDSGLKDQDLTEALAAKHLEIFNIPVIKYNSTVTKLFKNLQITMS